MGVGFLAFGLMMLLRPRNVRANLDRVANNWKQGGWHPYKMPPSALRLVGAVVVVIATLFFYIAFVAFCADC